METLGVLGVYGGLLCGILGWYFGRRQARKKNGLDEMYYHLMAKSQSLAWYMTLAALYVLMSLAIFDVNIGMMPALAILLLVHLGGWGTTFIILNVKYSDESFSLGKFRYFISLIICSVVATLFLIVSIVTGNWKFIIGASAPIAINISMIVSHAKEKNR